MTRTFRVGGYVSGGVLVLLGVAMIVIGFVGRSYVHDQLGQENIVGTPDMTPEETGPAVEEAGLADVIEIPDCSVAGDDVDNGAAAKCFADYMRVHALEATSGKTYAEMPRAVFEDSGKPVPEDQVEQALASGDAIDNPERQVWVSETSFATALNTSFFAEAVATFAIVVGFALVLIGVGLFVLVRSDRESTPAAA